MNVPLLVNTDVLVAGASTDAMQMALEAKKSGLRVFVISGYTYLGENICPTMNFWDESLAMFGELFPEWPERVPAPISVKRKLEHMLIENDIPFLFETHVLRLMRDVDGAYAGALIGNRSGLQIIRANMIIDGTERSLVARQTGMPFKPFVPGLKNIERIVFVDEQSDYNAPAMSVPFHLDGKPLFARKFSAALDMPDCSPGAFAAAELEMRRLSWSDAIIGSADRCRFMLEDSYCGHDPEAFVFIPGQLRGEGGAAVMASVYAHGEPCVVAALPDGISKTSPVSCGFVPSFRYADKRSCVVPDSEWEELGVFDVLVAGGGTGGAAAGIGAARSGVNTLVIENKSHLGGVGTEGRIAAYWFGNRVGFTAEVDKGVEALGGSVQDGSCKWKVEHKQQYWQDTALASGCKVWFDTLIVAVDAVDGLVRSLVCASPCGIGVVKAHAIVDATGNADVAAPAGAETFYSDPQEPALQ
ncbi:MAG: FAD-dependent oxidoreductase, partial [Victivallales bacterium]|nr:FAD-dependent oxidoreductase [Victivallales bacterium]